MSKKSKLICGHNGTDWDGNGNCISCARDNALSATGKDDELRKFIESWIPVNTMDAQHVRIAKLEAREEFLGLIKQYGLEQRTEGEMQALLDVDDHASYTVRKTVDADWVRNRAWEKEALLTTLKSKAGGRAGTSTQTIPRIPRGIPPR